VGGTSAKGSGESHGAGADSAAICGICLPASYGDWYLAWPPPAYNSREGRFVGRATCPSRGRTVHTAEISGSCNHRKNVWAPRKTKKKLRTHLFCGWTLISKDPAKVRNRHNRTKNLRFEADAGEAGQPIDLSPGWPTKTMTGGFFSTRCGALNPAMLRPGGTPAVRDGDLLLTVCRAGNRGGDSPRRAPRLPAEKVAFEWPAAHRRTRDKDFRLLPSVIMVLPG